MYNRWHQKLESEKEESVKYQAENKTKERVSEFKCHKEAPLAGATEHQAAKQLCSQVVLLFCRADK